MENFSVFDCVGASTTVIMKVIDFYPNYLHKKSGKVNFKIFFNSNLK